MNSLNSAKKIFMTGPAGIKRSVKRFCINKVLNVYEKWFIPPQSISLRDLKIKEFEDRKKLLHPYTRDNFIAQNSEDDKIMKLQHKVRMSNMHSFTLTYDRHSHGYPSTTTEFPSEYENFLEVEDLLQDPDWLEKLKPKRANFKKTFLIISLFVGFIWYQREQVRAFDADFRKMQRSMQNTEIIEFTKKKVAYSLYDRNNNEITSMGDNYTILWYDARMKNYIDLVQQLPKKRIATKRIKAVLIVEKLEHMSKVYSIETEAKDRSFKRNPRVFNEKVVEEKTKYLKAMKKALPIEVLRIPGEVDIKKKEELSQDGLNNDQREVANKLKESFGLAERSEEEEVELDLTKNTYYVLDENNIIIDCANIYSFKHENLIHQRIVSKINKDLEDKRKLS
ncbi:unnamed protein product [Moneuplotes crassus]|uniref:Uncharacterized protein n=1 Tax=Euplotes crassus TaxID=5936 RepID=A0AAD1UCY7_EUPCR|nr:unnamed protein product [Moneuplotes crassus]